MTASFAREFYHSQVFGCSEWPECGLRAQHLNMQLGVRFGPAPRRFRRHSAQCCSASDGREEPIYTMVHLTRRPAV